MSPAGRAAAVTTGLPRVLRALLLTAVVFALAVGAHLAGHGTLPDPLLLGVLLAATAAVAAPLTGRRLGPLTALGALAGGQLALHGALTSLAPAGCTTASAVGAEHGHVVAVAGSCTAVMPQSQPVVMLLAHAAATLATALLIASAERALFALLDWLAPLVRVPAAAVVPVVRPLLATGSRVVHPHQPPVLGLLLRRGPPSRRCTPAPV